MYIHSQIGMEQSYLDREVAGSIPGRVIPKTFKMVLSALSLGAQHQESRVRSGQLSVSLTWLGGIAGQSVWGVIFQWGSTLKSEHWAPCHIQTPSRYDWKIVESDVKPISNKQLSPHFNISRYHLRTRQRPAYESRDVTRQHPAYE